MSGKRQHHIPQFLLAGFATQSARGTPQVWVYDRKHGCFKTNTTNVGVEGHFYTDGDLDADEVVTDTEGEFSDLVSELRSGSLASLSDPLIPRMIVHFEIRTRQFRENLLHLGQQGIGGILERLAGNRGTERLIAYCRDNPAILDAAIEKAVAAGNLNPQLAGHVKALMPGMIKNDQAGRDAMIRYLRPRVAGEFSTVAKRSHIEALQKSTSPPKRVERLARLKYQVAGVGNTALILGDAIVLFHMEAPREYRNVHEHKYGLRNVYLPLSPSRLLVGTSENSATVPADMNRRIAQCSLEFFVARDESAHNRALHREIGCEASFLSDRDIDQSIERALGR